MERAEILARTLRTAGHRVTLVPPGRRVVQGVIECAPDLVLGSLSLVDPTLGTVVRSVRQALGQEPPVLVMYQSDLSSAPPETDEVVRESVESAELVLRVGRLIRERTERRQLQRKSQELLGLYKMSW